MRIFGAQLCCALFAADARGCGQQTEVGSQAVDGRLCERPSGCILCEHFAARPRLRHHPLADSDSHLHCITIAARDTIIVRSTRPIVSSVSRWSTHGNTTHTHSHSHTHSLRLADTARHSQTQPDTARHSQRRTIQDHTNTSRTRRKMLLLLLLLSFCGADSGDSLSVELREQPEASERTPSESATEMLEWTAGHWDNPSSPRSDSLCATKPHKLGCEARFRFHFRFASASAWPQSPAESGSGSPNCKRAARLGASLATRRRAREKSATTSSNVSLAPISARQIGACLIGAIEACFAYNLDSKLCEPSDRKQASTHHWTLNTGA